MSFDLVLFGGTGDLAWRKLMPALFQAWRHGKLPEGGRILAISRQDLDDETYRTWLKEHFTGVEDAKRPSDEEFGRFAALLHYLRLDLSRAEDYQPLRARLASHTGRARQAHLAVLFLAPGPHPLPSGLSTAQLPSPYLSMVAFLSSASLGNDAFRYLFPSD